MSALLPAAFNGGWDYRDRIRPADLAGRADSAVASQAAAAEVRASPLWLSAYYAARYPHSAQAVWLERIAAGQVWRNGLQLDADVPLAAGDQLVWHRPPWQEPAVPKLPAPLFDDGDLVVFNKPSGLQVLPAGGLLRHTVLGQLDVQARAWALQTAAGIPRPVHRLGRFTSGLLVCARSAGTRAWLSAQLHESTQRLVVARCAGTAAASACAKVYRALLRPPLPGSPLLALALDHSPEGVVETPIGRRPHPGLGAIWCAADPADTQALPSQSRFRLLAQRVDGWLVEVAITTGRPHQIRIHAAAAGVPLLGDPLFLPGGLARLDALPGEGGYHLHAHRLRLRRPDGRLLELEAPLPPALQARL